MATTAKFTCLKAAQSTFAGRTQVKAQQAPKSSGRTLAVTVKAEDRPLFFPGAVAPSYLNGELAGDFGWDPLGLGADETALKWYRQAELVHARWAMLGCVGILVQEATVPDVFWYEAALPENLPSFVNDDFNLGSLLAFEFLMMHYVEVRRWQDYKKPGSVNEDPLFPGNSVPGPEVGYPGGIFDPMGFSKGDLKKAQYKEIINGRAAMFAFAGMTIQAQALGMGPLACVKEHVASGGMSNIFANLGECVLPDSVVASGVVIPTPCLWP